MSREIKSPEPVLLTEKSFDGLHEIQFNEKSHRYKIDGKAAVGVTTFLKSSLPTSMGLIKWMQQQALDYFYANLKEYPLKEEDKAELFKESKSAHEKAAQDAADVGTVTHSIAELHSLNKFAEVGELIAKVKGAEKWPIISSCIEKYLAWATENKGELIKAEGLIASPTYLFCGKFDRLDKVNGKIRLRDYKTSKSIYPEQYLQLAAYALALKEWNNINVDELEVLRFGKEDGAFETLLIDKPEEIKMFQEQAIRCRQTYEFLKINNDPRFDWKRK